MMYTARMTKRLIDVDDDALDAARQALGTSTMKDTVNEALRLAAGHRRDELTAALEVIAAIAPADRADAWR
jgi:Arc/MetJ family transcription regulator